MAQFRGHLWKWKPFPKIPSIIIILFALVFNMKAYDYGVDVYTGYAYTSDSDDDAVKNTVLQVLSKLDQIPPKVSSPTTSSDGILVLATNQDTIRWSSLVSNLIFWNDPSKIKIGQTEGTSSWYVAMHEYTPLPRGHTSQKDYTHQYVTLHFPNENNRSLAASNERRDTPVVKLVVDDGWLYNFVKNELFKKFDRIKVVFVLKSGEVRSKYYTFSKFVYMNNTINTLLKFLPADFPPQSVAFAVVDHPENYYEHDYEKKWEYQKEQLTKHLQEYLNALQNVPRGRQEIRKISVLESVLNGDRMSFVYKPQINGAWNLEMALKHEMDRIVSNTQFYSLKNEELRPYPNPNKLRGARSEFTEEKILEFCWFYGGVEGYKVETHDKLCRGLSNVGENETMSEVVNKAIEAIGDSSSHDVRLLEKAKTLDRVRVYFEELAIGGTKVAKLILEKYGDHCPRPLNRVRTHSQVTCSEDMKRATVFGKVVVLSEIVGETDEYESFGNSVLPCDQGGLEEFLIFATERVIIDTNVTARGKELKFGVIAPIWEIPRDERVYINLNGTKGKRHIPPLVTQPPLEFGANGIMGIPGNPGSDGGIFLAIYGNFSLNSYGSRGFRNGLSSPRYIWFDINPGPGGKGQGGGPGADGGPPPRDKTMADMPPATRFLGYEIPDDLKNSTRAFWHPEKWRWGYREKIYLVIPGQPGVAGGHAGFGGIGGPPGRPGSVLSIQLSNLQVIKGQYDRWAFDVKNIKEAHSGIRGSHNHRGRGGIGGRGFRCMLVDGHTNPQWNNCEHWSRSSAGKNGEMGEYFQRNPYGNPQKEEENKPFVYGRIIEQFLGAVDGEMVRRTLSENELRFVKSVQENLVVKEKCTRKSSFPVLLANLDRKLLGVIANPISWERFEPTSQKYFDMRSSYQHLSTNLLLFSSQTKSGPGSASILNATNAAIQMKILGLESAEKVPLFPWITAEYASHALSQLVENVESIANCRNITSLQQFFTGHVNRSRNLIEKTLNRTADYVETEIMTSLELLDEIFGNQNNSSLENNSLDVTSGIETIIKTCQLVSYGLLKSIRSPQFDMLMSEQVKKDASKVIKHEQIFMEIITDLLNLTSHYSIHKSMQNYVINGKALYSDERVKGINGSASAASFLRQEEALEKERLYLHTYGVNMVDEIAMPFLYKTSNTTSYLIEREKKAMKPSQELQTSKYLVQRTLVENLDLEGNLVRNVSALKQMRIQTRSVLHNSLSIIPTDYRESVIEIFKKLDEGINQAIQLELQRESIDKLEHITGLLENVDEDSIPTKEKYLLGDALGLLKYHFQEQQYFEALQYFGGLVQWRLPRFDGYHFLNRTLYQNLNDSFVMDDLGSISRHFRDNLKNIQVFVQGLLDQDSQASGGSGTTSTDSVPIEVTLKCNRLERDPVPMETTSQNWTTFTRYSVLGTSFQVENEGGNVKLNDTLLKPSTSQVDNSIGYFSMIFYCQNYYKPVKCKNRQLGYSTAKDKNNTLAFYLEESEVPYEYRFSQEVNLMYLVDDDGVGQALKVMPWKIYTDLGERCEKGNNDDDYKDYKELQNYKDDYDY